MDFKLPSNLQTLVRSRYEAAKASNNLIFSETQLAVIRTEAGVLFQLRYCPTLAKKPTSNPNNDTDKDAKPKPKPKPDPFTNPSKDLLITTIPHEDPNPTHLLVLNKFPVIPEHFILATWENKPQTHLLEEDDLGATYACLRAWRDGSREELFAFFNSGEHSGASQPHRHLQFLPVEKMREQDGSEGWDVLVNGLVNKEADDSQNPHSTTYHTANLPFTTIAARLPPAPTPSFLHSLYLRLYASAVKVSSVRARFSSHTSTNPPPDHQLPSSGPSEISYNLALTTHVIAICPRRAGGAMLKRNDGSEVGFVDVNGTVLGGTLMVKGDEEWDVLKKGEHGGLDSVLERIGYSVEDGKVQRL